MGTVVLKDWEKFEIFCKPAKIITSKEFLEELYKGRKEDEKENSSA